jgi:hypothetical protein
MKMVLITLVIFYSIHGKSIRTCTRVQQENDVFQQSGVMEHLS